MKENKQVLLCSRPTGIAQKEHFRIVNADIVPPGVDQVLVRNIYLSVEPAMRGWIADTQNYTAPVELGGVMRSLSAGIVVKSNIPEFAEGDHVVGWFGWQQFATVGAAAVERKIQDLGLPLSLYLGVLGINGITALLALTKIGEPRPGQTVLVSTAAGAVGSAVGQIAKIHGCRTVGITGGSEKVRLCKEIYRYDAAVDYRNDNLDTAIRQYCPEGVNIYFDNVAGPISDIAIRHLALRGRIVVCGTASIADWNEQPSGPRVERHLLVKRARMEGFVIFDYADDADGAIQQLAKWIKSGELAYREDILDGIETAPDALAGLYRGENSGKRLIKVG